MSDVTVDLTQGVVELDKTTAEVDLAVGDNVQELLVDVEVFEANVQEEVRECAVVAETVDLDVQGLVWPSGEEESVPAYDLEIDQATPGVTYYGQAQPGSATDQPVWRISRVTTNAGGLSREWAGGTAAFDKVWDDRVSLSYGP